MTNEIYNGFNVKFDEKTELWYVCVDEDGKPAKYDSSDNRVQNVSLKKLKETIDILQRKQFTRISVIVSAKNYRYGGGKDGKYEKQYEDAVLTSISPNGNAFVVRAGSKHGERFGLRYGNSGIILDTKENRATIAKIEEEGERKWRAEVEQEKLKKQLKELDGQKAFQDVYGKLIAQ